MKKTNQVKNAFIKGTWKCKIALWEWLLQHDDSSTPQSRSALFPKISKQRWNMCRIRQKTCKIPSISTWYPKTNIYIPLFRQTKTSILFMGWLNTAIKTKNMNSWLGKPYRFDTKTKRSYLIFWSGQTWFPGPTQKYLVLVNQGSSYVTERARNSAERK